MRGSEFLRKVRALAVKKDLTCSFDARHGKGSHGRLLVGERQTALKDLKKEIGKGLLKSMCNDLGIDSTEL